MDKQELRERFERIYHNCKLYCVQLNGFSHTIFYKDKDGNKHIGCYSAYYSERHDKDETLYEDNVYRATNTDNLKAFFLGYPHYCYQHNAKEIIFENISKW